MARLSDSVIRGWASTFEAPSDNTLRIRDIVDNIIDNAGPEDETSESPLRGRNISSMYVDELSYIADRDDISDASYRSLFADNNLTRYYNTTNPFEGESLRDIPGQLTRVTKLESTIDDQARELQEHKEQIKELQETVNNLNSKIKLIMAI